MTADDTSRDALIERVEELLHDLWNSRGRVDVQATAVVDAVVLPLVQERDRLRENREAAIEAGEGVAATLAAERDAAIKRAEAAEVALAAVRELVDDRSRQMFVTQNHGFYSKTDYSSPLVRVSDLRAILDEHGAPE